MIVSDEDDDIFQMVDKASLTSEYGYRNKPEHGDDNVINFDDYKER